jgi:hypothetical protein
MLYVHTFIFRKVSLFFIIFKISACFFDFLFCYSNYYSFFCLQIMFRHIVIVDKSMVLRSYIT